MQIKMKRGFTRRSFRRIEKLPDQKDSSLREQLRHWAKTLLDDEAFADWAKLHISSEKT